MLIQIGDTVVVNFHSIDGAFFLLIGQLIQIWNTAIFTSLLQYSAGSLIWPTDVLFLCDPTLMCSTVQVHRYTNLRTKSIRPDLRSFQSGPKLHVRNFLWVGCCRVNMWSTNFDLPAMWLYEWLFCFVFVFTGRSCVISLSIGVYRLVHTQLYTHHVVTQTYIVDFSIPIDWIT